MSVYVLDIDRHLTLDLRSQSHVKAMLNSSPLIMSDLLKSQVQDGTLVMVGIDIEVAEKL